MTIVAIAKIGDDAILLRSAGEIKKLKRTGLALGLAAKSLYEKVEENLNPNDSLFIYIDSITEAMNN